MSGKKNIYKERALKQKKEYHQIWDWSSCQRKGRNIINERATKIASSGCINILFLNLDDNYMGVKIYICIF